MTRPNMGIWGTLTKAVFVLLFLAGLLAVAVWYLPVIEKSERYRHEILRLEQEIAKEEAAARHLKAAIVSLQTDSNVVGRLGRERLGLARPEETVIRFEAPAANDADAGP